MSYYLTARLEGEMGPDDYVGRAEVESGWPEGYDKMTEVDASKVRK